jgi:lipoprotein-releasing system permease protein
MKIALKIAWRFLASNRGQTILIALGIAIGVSVQVFIGSLIAGLQKSLVETTIGRSSQITVSPAARGGLIADADTLTAQIAEIPGVATVSGAADGSGFARLNGDAWPVLVRGFDLTEAEGIYRLSEALVAGGLPGDGEIVLGRDLMDEAGIAMGDTVTLLTAAGNARDVVVSGEFDLKVSSLNKSWAIGSLSLAQDLFGYGSALTSIEIQVDDPFAADTVSAEIAGILPEGLTVDDWKAQNASLLSGLSGQSISSLMIQVFVMISVVLGIASVLAISVMQKSRQIGILKAMGIKNRTASAVFLTQGLILGAFGALMGVALGLGLALMFTKFAVNPDGTPVVALFIDPQFIALSGLIAVVASTLAALVPARRSSRLDPMEVIRNG